MTIEDLRAKMPKVGDILFLSTDDRKEDDKKRCKVVYAHPTHCWFTVEFEQPNGKPYRETYKLPHATYRPGLDGFKRVSRANIDPDPRRVLIVELNKIFDSATECAKFLDRDRQTVVAALRNGSKVARYTVHWTD